MKRMSDYRDNGLSATVWRDERAWVVKMCNGTEARFSSENLAEIAAENYVLRADSTQIIGDLDLENHLQIVEIDGIINLKPRGGFL